MHHFGQSEIWFFAYHRLQAHATFDKTYLPAFVRALDVIFKCSVDTFIYHNTVHNKFESLPSRLSTGTSTEGGGWAAAPGAWVGGTWLQYSAGLFGCGRWAPGGPDMAGMGSWCSVTTHDPCIAIWWVDFLIFVRADILIFRKFIKLLLQIR